MNLLNSLYMYDKLCNGDRSDLFFRVFSILDYNTEKDREKLIRLNSDFRKVLRI